MRCPNALAVSGFTTEMRQYFCSCVEVTCVMVRRKTGFRRAKEEIDGPFGLQLAHTDRAANTVNYGHENNVVLTARLSHEYDELPTIAGTPHRNSGHLLKTSLNGRYGFSLHSHKLGPYFL
jgi:hypothetical protein